MYQKLRTLVFHTLVPAVLAVLLLPIMAFAQEISCTASIPVEITVSGSRIPSDVPYKLKLEAVTSNAPMPSSAELVLVNGGKSSFGPITYTAPGKYEYRIYQNSEPQNRFTYDKRVYRVAVRVLNDDKGGLLTQIWAADEETSGEEKVESILFANSYSRPGGGGGGGGGSSSDGDPDPVPGPGPEGGKGDGLIEIGDNETPLGGLTQIFDEGVPLGGLPKTGDTTMLSFWILMAVLSGCGIIALAVFRKRMDGSE